MSATIEIPAVVLNVFVIFQEQIILLKGIFFFWKFIQVLQNEESLIRILIIQTQLGTFHNIVGSYPNR